MTTINWINNLTKKNYYLYLKKKLQQPKRSKELEELRKLFRC